MAGKSKGDGGYRALAGWRGLSTFEDQLFAVDAGVSACGASNVAQSPLSLGEGGGPARPTGSLPAPVLDLCRWTFAIILADMGAVIKRNSEINSSCAVHIPSFP